MSKNEGKDRKFDVESLHRHDGKRLLLESAEIFSNDYYRSFVPGIEGLITASKDPRNVNNPHRHLGLQREMLGLLQNIEQASSEGKKLAAKENDTEIARQSKRNNYLSKAVRTIADGLAWRTLGFDRFYMKVLAQGRFAGHTWGKDAGRSEELKRAKNVADHGARVLINDVTDWLRVGDLVTMPKGATSPSIAEIKKKEIIHAHSISKKLDKKRKLDKQEIRLFQAQVSVDMRAFAFTDDEVVMIPVKPVGPNFMNGVSATLKQAVKKGVSTRMLSPYMRVEAMDLSEIFKMSKEEFTAKLGENEPPKLESIAEHSNYDRLITSAYGELTRGALPYTVYPFPTNIIAKIITGEMYLSVSVFLKPLGEEFAKYGYELVFDEKRMDEYEPITDADSVRDFSSHKLFASVKPDGYNGMILMKNPKTGFMLPIGDLVVQMVAEFTSVSYIVSIARQIEPLAEKELEEVGGDQSRMSLKYFDINDRRRWQ